MDVFPYKNTFWNWQAPITSETKFNITTATQKIRNERNEEENSMYDNKRNQGIKFYLNAAYDWVQIEFLSLPVNIFWNNHTYSFVITT